MADIGKIAVSFTASAGGLIEGAGKASDALHKFAVDAATASASLDGKYASDFSIRIDELTAKLAAGDVTASAFGATLDSAFTRATPAIDSGLSASLGVLSKELDVGLLSAKSYTDGMTDLSQRASTAIGSALSDSIKASTEAMESSGTTMTEFVTSITMLAGTAAGAGVEQLTAGITSLSHALGAGSIDSETFLASQRDLAQTGAVDAIERTREAMAALQGPLEDGRLSAEDFTAAATAISTSFRVEVMTEYETNIVALTAALDAGAITTEEFKDQHDTLNAALRTTVVGDLEQMLRNLPDAYAAAGRSAEELVVAQEAVRKEIEQTNKALDAAEKRSSKPPAPVPSGGGGGGAGGVMHGLEKFGGAASLIPGELGHIGHMMEQVSKSAGMFAKGITSVFPSMAGMSVGLGLMAAGAVVVGGAIMALVSGFAKAARESQAMADQFGMTLKQVAVLKQVFDMVGVSVQQFALVSKSINASLTQASNGAARASAAYAQIGVSVEELRAQSPEEQFKSIIIALAGVEDAGQRSALAIQLLGRQGAQMAAKFGTDVAVIEKRFVEAEEEVERFKTAFSEINSAQLIEAGGKIAGIGAASEGLGKVVAEAFAPLAGGLGSAVADVLGGITNALLLISPIVNLIGAGLGGYLLLFGSIFNTVMRCVAAVAKILYLVLPLEAASSGIMWAFNGLAETFAGIARYVEDIADSIVGWFGGKTKAELKAIADEVRRIAVLTEVATALEEKYGDKTDEVLFKIRAVNEAYKAGLIDKDVRVAALKDLNKELAVASPRLKALADAKKAMDDALGAASAAASVGNTGGTTQAKRALEEYRKARREMYADFKNKTISEDAYSAGIDGLAAKFDAEMRRVSKVKLELDYGHAQNNKSMEKTGADKALDDFKRYEAAKAAGGTFTSKEERGARETTLNTMIGGLGLNAPKMSGLDAFEHQMAELNRMYEEQTTVLKITAEEEKKLAGARQESIRQMIDALPDAKKSVSDTQQFGENMRKLDEAQVKLDQAKGMTAEERAGAQEGIDARRGRLQSEYKGTPDSPTAAFDKILSDIEAERAKLQTQMENPYETPKAQADAKASMQVLNDKEQSTKDDFLAQNQDLLDSVMKGGQANKSANSAIDATSSEGAATYLRILRGGESLTGKQLTELRNSRLILAKIEQKVGPIKAANIP